MRCVALCLLLVLGSLMTVAGCGGAAVDMAKEEMGYQKRDILVTDVKKARDTEDDAKQQFQTTLQQFQAVTHFNGGDLEAEYNKLSAQYDSCESRAKDVSSRIKEVQRVAARLFDEWQSELSQYTNPDLRRASENKLNETKVRYEKLIGVMKAAEQRMQPVLAAFHDQVLFLKHNLNAAAIASLSTTASGIDTDVAQLIRDMNASIAEADSFVNQMK